MAFLRLFTASAAAFLAAAEDIGAALASNDECSAEGCAVNALQRHAAQTDQACVPYRALYGSLFGIPREASYLYGFLLDACRNSSKDKVDNFEAVEGQEAADFLEGLVDGSAYDDVNAVDFLQEFHNSSQEVDLLEYSSESERACNGGGSIKSGCYGGNFLTEIFFVKVSGGGGHGKVSMWAKGPKSGQCIGRSFSQSGQSIRVNTAGCGLDGVQYSVHYCSAQDEVHVVMTSPMAVDVVLNKKSCR